MIRNLIANSEIYICCVRKIMKKKRFRKIHALLARLPIRPKKENLFGKFWWGSFCSILCGDVASGNLDDTLKPYSKLKVILFLLNRDQNSLSPPDLKVFLRSCHYSMHIRTWILEHMLLLDQIEEEKTSRLKLHNWSQNLSEVVFEQVWTNLNISNFHKSMNNFKQVFKSLCKFECCFNFTRWTRFYGDFIIDLALFWLTLLEFFTPFFYVACRSILYIFYILTIMMNSTLERPIKVM